MTTNTPTPDELADQVIDELLADVHYEKTYPAHTAYYQFDEAAAKKKLSEVLSQNRKQVLGEGMMSKADLNKILLEYQQYEIDLMEQEVATGAPRPKSHRFSFARFFNWMNGLSNE